MPPTFGETVFVRPRNPAVRVQRGAGLHGQFLAPQGQTVRWDEFLQRRFDEGDIELAQAPRPAPPAPEPAPPEAPPAPSDKEVG